MKQVLFGPNRSQKAAMKINMIFGDMKMNEVNSNGSEKKVGWTFTEGGIALPKGFKTAGVKAEIRYKDKYDVAVIYSEVPANAAGVFTRNKVKAHPLLLNMKHLSKGTAQAIVVNSGNANACVGPKGDAAAWATAEKAAELFGLQAEEVLVGSTGIIGVELPVERLLTGVEQAVEKIKGGDQEQAVEASHEAALAIMTTDIISKEAACELKTSNGVIHLGAMAKGSGMIHPNMGTMLGFVTTDAEIPQDRLQILLKESVEDSFNMVTVDGDTSTNDMVLVLANGASGVKPEGVDWEAFKEMFQAVLVKLAKDIARDGEGATKLLEVNVKGARSKEDAKLIAKSIAGSSLVKTAVFGEEANWGRVLCASGYSGAAFDPTKVEVWFGDLLMAKDGAGVNFSEERASEILAKKNLTFTVILQEGTGEATAWGCDLTHDYITINGSYRS